MSYCRKGPKSDVYMFVHVDGYIECCDCELVQRTYYPKNAIRYAWYEFRCLAGSILTVLTNGKQNCHPGLTELFAFGPIFSSAFPRFENAKLAYDHLKAHRAAGHAVEPRAFKSVKADFGRDLRKV